MRAVCWARSALLPLCLSVFSLPLGPYSQTAAQTATPQNPPPEPLGQGGAIQMPIRICDLHDFNYDYVKQKLNPALHEPFDLTPIGAMVQGPPGDDSFYSTSQFGGTHNLGTVFKVTANGDKADVNVLYSFGDGGPLDGKNPMGGLTLGHDGNFYGTTNYGGKYNAGTIFRISRAGSIEPLYSFRNGMPDPPVKGQPPPPPLTEQEKDDLAAATPFSAPLLGVDGSLYGVTSNGVLYQFDLGGRTLKCVHRFRFEERETNGLTPMCLSRGWDGGFFGTTNQGGLGLGTVFQFNPSGKSFNTLYRFKLNDGAVPYCVIQGFDRNLYGTLSAGGKYGRGVAYKLTLDGDFSALHSFGGTDSRPGPGVVEVLQNDPVKKAERAYFLYGAALGNYSIPARFDTGIIYRAREQAYTEPENQGKEFSVVYNTDSTGAYPSTTPVLGRDSNLYGSMAAGGRGQQGTFYRLNTAFEVTGDPGTYKTPDGTTHSKLVLMGDPGGRSLIFDDRSPIQIVTHVAGFQTWNSDASKASTSDGITVRVKDIAPYPFWPRPNDLKDRARFVQFFYRQRLDDNSRPIQGWAEKWNPRHTYIKDQRARYNNYLWISTKNDNTNHPPPSNQDCLAKPSGCTDPFWTPFYFYIDPYTHRVTGWGPCAPAEIKTRNCTLEPPCTDTYAAGYECVPLTSDPARPYWVVDARGRLADASMSTGIDPYYLPIDTQIDCDGVTLFDSPTLFPYDPDEVQQFTALDYIIIGEKVVASVMWTLEKQPNAAPEAYGINSILPAPPDYIQQRCFADLLERHHFQKAFTVPPDAYGNEIKCPYPISEPPVTHQ